MTKQETEGEKENSMTEARRESVSVFEVVDRMKKQMAFKAVTVIFCVGEYEYADEYCFFLCFCHGSFQSFRHRSIDIPCTSETSLKRAFYTSQCEFVQLNRAHTSIHCTLTALAWLIVQPLPCLRVKPYVYQIRRTIFCVVCQGRYRVVCIRYCFLFTRTNPYTLHRESLTSFPVVFSVLCAHFQNAMK